MRISDWSSDVCSSDLETRCSWRRRAPPPPLYFPVATCGGSVSERVERALQLQRARLYGYAVSLTRDRESARDLLQDCAVKALSASSAPTDDAALRAWLFRILRNAWIDRIDRKSTRLNSSH